MEKPEHILIDNLGNEYADSILRGRNAGESMREEIKAAYVAGAEATLRRLVDMLKINAGLSAITREQLNDLLCLIETVETTFTSVRI